VEKLKKEIETLRQHIAKLERHKTYVFKKMMIMSEESEKYNHTSHFLKKLNEHREIYQKEIERRPAIYDINL